MVCLHLVNMPVSSQDSINALRSNYSLTPFGLGLSRPLALPSFNFLSSSTVIVQTYDGFNGRA